MTTIATRGDGVVAADTLCVWGDDIKLRVTKLHRLKDGSIVAGCGNVAQILAAIDWVASGMRDDPPSMKACDVLVVRPGGVTATVCANGILSPVNGPIALGTGAQAAMAAMEYFGASAEEAVMAAASVDPRTSAPVDVMRVEPKAKRKRK